MIEEDRLALAFQRSMDRHAELMRALAESEKKDILGSGVEELYHRIMNEFSRVLRGILSEYDTLGDDLEDDDQPTLDI